MCEAQEGAAARSKFQLAEAMQEGGDKIGSDRLLAEVEADLARCGHDVRADQVTHDFLDQFVVISRR